MIFITAHADGLALQAPFHPDLPLHAKALGGRWKGSEACWTFPTAQSDALRSLCLRMWGVDGTPEASSDVVQLRIEFDEKDIRYPIWRGFNRAVYLVGREIAVSLKNRRAAWPGRGVKFLRGRPHCRSDVHSYWTTIPDGSVFLLSDTPRMAVDRFQATLQGHGHMAVLAS